MLNPESPARAHDSNVRRVLKSDVYSFGVTVWEIVERKRPHEGMDGFQVGAGSVYELTFLHYWRDTKYWQATCPPAHCQSQGPAALGRHKDMIELTEVCSFSDRDWSYPDACLCRCKQRDSFGKDTAVLLPMSLSTTTLYRPPKPCPSY